MQSAEQPWRAGGESAASALPALKELERVTVEVYDRFAATLRNFATQMDRLLADAQVAEMKLAALRDAQAAAMHEAEKRPIP